MSAKLPPHVAISVGHRKGAQGVAVDGISEWSYNLPVAHELQKRLLARGIESVVVERPNRSVWRGTGESRERLNPYLRQIRKVSKTQALCAVELHLNGAESPWARGREVLSSGSKGSLELAEALRDAMNRTLPENQDRGIKIRSINERGGPFLHFPAMPCVIVEPWFLTNEEDRRQALWYGDLYLDALEFGILNYLKGIGALE